jgi:hypothetical protein
MPANNEIAVNLGPWNSVYRELRLPDTLLNVPADPSLTSIPPIQEVDARFFTVSVEQGLQTLRLPQSGRLFAIHFGVDQNRVNLTQADTYTREFQQSVLKDVHKDYGTISTTWDADSSQVSVVFTHSTLNPDYVAFSDKSMLTIGKMIQDIWRRCGNHH